MKLNEIEKHQLRIAKATLKLPNAMANALGGMTKAEAKKIKKTLEFKQRMGHHKGLTGMASTKYEGIGGI